MPTISKECLVKNRYGLHARPVAMLIRIASQFKADVFLEKDGTRMSGKSIMGLMTLEASCGTKLIVIAEGPDAQQAVDAITKVIDDKFGED